jgi:phage terminase large subunit-like protein
LKRNTRDKVYNITLKNEDALLLSSFLYKDSNLFLNRKYDNFLNIMKWERIKEKSNRRSWTEEEDEYILSHSIEESIIYLNRTKSSIKNRKTRLKSK